MKNTHQVDTFERNMIVGMLIFIGGLIILSAFSGCAYTEGMASRDMDKAKDKHEIVAAGKCRIWYPVRVFRDSVNVLIPGKEILLPPEYVLVDCDSVMETVKDQPKGSGKVSVPCPPCKFRVDTNLIITSSQAENTAAIREMELKRDAEMDRANKKELELVAMTASRQTFRNWAIWLAVLIGAYGVYRVIKWKFLKK